MNDSNMLLLFQLLGSQTRISNEDAPEQDLHQLCFDLLKLLQVPYQRIGSEQRFLLTAPLIVKFHHIFTQIQEARRNFSLPVIPPQNPSKTEAETHTHICEPHPIAVKTEEETTREEEGEPRIQNTSNNTKTLPKSTRTEKPKQSATNGQKKLINEEQCDRQSEILADDEKATMKLGYEGVLLDKIETQFGIAFLSTADDEKTIMLNMRPNLKAQQLISSVEECMTSQNGIKNGEEERMKVSSTYLKNFPKMLGDQFEKFLAGRKIESKNAFKDKLSWKLLNKFLQGDLKLENISTKTFVSLFIQFLSELTLDQVEKSKSRDEGIRAGYRILLNFLKEGANIIQGRTWVRHVSKIAVKKVWPYLELYIMQERI